MAAQCCNGMQQKYRKNALKPLHALTLICVLRHGRSVNTDFVPDEVMYQDEVKSYNNGHLRCWLSVELLADLVYYNLSEDPVAL